MAKDPSGGVPADQQTIVDNTIGSAQVAQEGATFAHTVGYVAPVIDGMVDSVVDYAQTNTDPTILGGAEVPSK